MTECDVCKESFDEQEIVIKDCQLSERERYLAFICKDCLQSKEEDTL
jgi:hypothetical protein